MKRNKQKCSPLFPHSWRIQLSGCWTIATSERGLRSGTQSRGWMSLNLVYRADSVTRCKRVELPTSAPAQIQLEKWWGTRFLAIISSLNDVFSVPPHYCLWHKHTHRSLLHFSFEIIVSALNIRSGLNRIKTATVPGGDEGGAISSSRMRQWDACASLVWDQRWVDDDRPCISIVIPIKKSKPLFSEEGWNRHEIGKDAKQLAGKLTRAVAVWKYFNNLESISKMVDSSDSVWRQRAAL